jgi:hypothetical protein
MCNQYIKSQPFDFSVIPDYAAFDMPPGTRKKTGPNIRLKGHPGHENTPLRSQGFE